MTGHHPTRIRAGSLWFLALALLLMGANPRTALAESPEAEHQARRLFESAEAHFRSGLFAEALAEYQAGYEIHPLPGFLINIAQCQRRLGNLSVAQATYRKFIMVAPDSPFVPQVRALIAELDTLNQDLAGTNSEAKPENAPKEGERPKPTESESPSPSPSPSTTSADVTLVSPPPVAQPQSKTRWWLWGTIGAVAVGAITAIVLVSLPQGNKTVHDGSLGTLRR